MRQRLLLSLLSGLLLGLAMPMQWGHWVPPNLGFLAWVAVVPLIIACQGLRPSRAFVIAFPGMLLGHTLMVYWFFMALHDFGHMSVVTSILVTFLALLFLATLSSLAPLGVAWLERRGPTIWAWPLMWAVVEFSRNFDPLLDGFTFCNLINSQYQYTTLLQILRIIGPYWFLALMILVNVAIARWFTDRRRALRLSVIVASMLVGVAVYGAVSKMALRADSKHWPMLRVALVQGNIPQDEKWDQALLQRNFDSYRQASRAALASHPDLIIWPEASFPWVYPSQTQQLPAEDQLFDHLGDAAPFVLMGAVTSDVGGKHRNSALLLDGGGRLQATYHKYHLVPFGEYVPYQKLFFFAKALTAQAGNLMPGEAVQPIMMSGMPLGVLVCYEDTFPEIARRLVQQGSTFLVNITNDAWYGWSAAARQHLASSVLRAIENMRTVVRATNTGISAVIAPDGEIVLEGAMFEKAVIVSGIRLGSEQTLYTRWGQWVDLALIGFVIFFAWRQRRPLRRLKLPHGDGDCRTHHHSVRKTCLL